MNNKNLIGYSNQTIRDILGLIDTNARGICFIAESSSSLKIIGLVTDGDIRRGLLRGVEVSHPITKVMNTDFVSLPVESSENLVRKLFNSKIKMIPLLNSAGEIVDIADVMKSHLIPVLEPDLSGNESEYVLDCIQTNWISSQGAYVSRFERQFEALHPGMSAVAVSNGTAALHLALLSLGIGPGHEVIVPNITFAATINAVLHCGATPVICEINPSSWCIDIEEVERLITDKTKAMIPVHLYGQVCDMDRLMSSARKNNVYVIEDCAESFGSEIEGRLAGSFGDVSTFSFFGNKTISTGEGGMILFKNDQHHALAKVLRDHGMTPGRRYWHDLVGYNYRLTNLQAAIGVAQLERFNAILANKRRIAKHYDSLLQDALGIEQLPHESPKTVHSNWLYTIRLSQAIDRDVVVSKLLMFGIETRPVFYPLNKMPPYQNFKTSIRLDVSNNLSMYGLSLPSSVGMSSAKIEFVSKSLREILNGMMNNA